jgi:hypothetical protein
MEKIYLSRRNLLTLLSKLDRAGSGERTECTIIKNDPTHSKYPQSCDCAAIVAIEDDEYYSDRAPGRVPPTDLRRVVFA